jgi:hypothetical protein
MTETSVEKVVEILRSPGLQDQLATAEHERWAHWQSYMHDHGQRHPDGSLTLPAHLVAQWDGQIKRPFDELTEQEKDSDREQVDRYLPLIERAIRTRV